MSIKETTKEVTAENDRLIKELIPNGVKRGKTPRQFESILKGALALDLHERVELKKRLAQSITDEVDAAKKRAEEAAKIAQE